MLLLQAVERVTAGCKHHNIITTFVELWNYFIQLNRMNLSKPDYTIEATAQSQRVGSR
jgi:hypothetical protein